MSVKTKNERATTHNVIGFIKGSVEPGKVVYFIATLFSALSYVASQNMQFVNDFFVTIIFVKDLFGEDKCFVYCTVCVVDLTSVFKAIRAPGHFNEF